MSLVCLLAVAALGCESEEAPSPISAADAAVTADGAAPDARPQPDAADAPPAVDAAAPDAAPLDSGAELDAEARADGGPDAAVEADAGPEADAALGDDAGPEPDAAPEPIEDCVGPDPALAPDAPERAEGDCPTCVGSPPPEWALRDVQPQSCGIGQTYGLNAFIGQTTLFALFNASCGTCQAQSQMLEQMRFEFLLEGRDVHFVALNSASNADYIDRLTDRCAFTILQDELELDVWHQHVESGGVSDFFIYGRDGRLVQYIDYTAHDPEVMLTLEEGYQNLKQAIIDADDQ